LQRFHENLDLVERICSQVRRNMGYHLDAAELRSFGQEGLLLAARRFDPSLGVPFTAYATFRVRGAIIDGIRASGELPRRIRDKLRALEIADQVSEHSAEEVLGTPSPQQETRQEAQRLLEDHLAKMATAIALGLLPQSATLEEGVSGAIAGTPNPEEATLQAELRLRLEQIVESLPEDEATLVRSHYWEGERFDHVAERLGLSKSWASRLHSRALGRVARRMRKEE
jgi:RNA polymerase sigma factor for flagellar operon FliA